MLINGINAANIINPKMLREARRFSGVRSVPLCTAYNIYTRELEKNIDILGNRRFIVR